MVTSEEHLAFWQCASEKSRQPPQAPSPGTTSSISAWSHHGFQLCLRASVLYLELLCAAISKVTASLLYSISFYERNGAFYFWIGGGKPMCVCMCVWLCQSFQQSYSIESSEKEQRFYKCSSELENSPLVRMVQRSSDKSGT